MSASAEIIGDSASRHSVTDGLGRQLLIKRLSALDRLRLFKALGPHLAQNSSYLGMALLAVSVSEIDGVPVPMPTNESQLESLVSRLGDTGIQAAASTLQSIRADAGEENTLGN